MKKTQPNNFVIHMQGITKRFPGVIANEDVEFTLRKGEIHALLGENGAGKSTLMNVLAGLYRPEEGKILHLGEEVSLNSPKDAIDIGIGMIHQHFMLVPSQTVTENILLGLDNPRIRLNLVEYDHKVQELGEQFNLRIDPRAKIWQLSVGEQQRVEIIKMLYRGADILIMDEPTAVLAPTEIETLFETLKTMVEKGKSIIFISHKLNEVLAISDRITVLSKGKVTATGLPTAGKSQADLARLMVGREVVFNLDKKDKEPGDEVLCVKDLHALNDKGLAAVNGISLNVRSGEIVGIAGVAGNGQRELVEIVTGLRKCSSGKIKVNGQDLTNKSSRAGIDLGVAHVPSDRTEVGSSPNLGITDNLIMKSYRQAPISKGMSLDKNEAVKFAGDLKEKYDIITPTLETPSRMLSGGNLQRVILAREFSGSPSLIVAMQPTRGLDVGAIEGVQGLLLEQRQNGAAVLLISEELEELFALSDRIYVIYEGMIMGMMEEPDIDSIGLMMTGTKQEDLETELNNAN